MREMSGQMRGNADGGAGDTANDGPDRADGGSPGGELLVRPAHVDDRQAVLAFCDRIWGEHDYIAEVWDDWLREERAGSGVPLVGILAGRPVGIAHLRMVSEDEGWIEGIRVDPDARRQGIGRTLTSRALVAAREHGATVARLFVDADNLASQALVARFGFTRVAELVRYRAPALPLDTGEQAEIALATPGEADFERIWSWLEQSNLTPFNGGLEIADWAAHALTEPALRAHLAAGELRLLEEWGTIQALAILEGTDGAGADDARAAVEGEDKSGDEAAALEVAYLDGASEGIGRMTLALRRVAGERGLGQVRLWLPDLLILRDAMDGAGYQRPEDDEPLYLYARDL
jgi:ribosomal protein S18 acetylase RimI-like enzyme